MKISSCILVLAPVEPALAEIAAPRWFQQSAISPDGSRVVYGEALTAPGKSAIYIHAATPISDCAKAEVYIAPAAGGAARQIAHLTGLLQNPRWSPNGKRVALLSTENLPHRAGPLDPVPPDSGVIESKIYEQRIAVADVAAASTRQVSPARSATHTNEFKQCARLFT